MMVKQWGKNPEYTFYAYINWRVWALPIRIVKDKIQDIIGNKRSAFCLEIFCFGFEIERWKWSK